MSTLIAYYSQARGNTKRIAEKIAAAKGYDLMPINTLVPYTGSYEEIVDQGQDEVNRHFKPELKPLEKDLSGYDRLIVMTPTWWYTMAPAVLTFLSENDLTGKKLVLVQTHGGWPGHVMKDMKSAAKGAVIEGEYKVRFDSEGGDTLVTPEREIDSWIAKLFSKDLNETVTYM